MQFKCLLPILASSGIVVSQATELKRNNLRSDDAFSEDTADFKAWDELLSINIGEFIGFGDKDTANSLSMLNVEGDFFAFEEGSGASDTSDASTTDSSSLNDAAAAPELADSWQFYNEQLAWAYTVDGKAAKAMTDGKAAKAVYFDVGSASTMYAWQLYNENVAGPFAVNSKAAKADAKSAKVGPKSSKAGEFSICKRNSIML